MDYIQPVIDSLKEFISDPKTQENATEIFKKSATDPNPMLALSSNPKGFTILNDRVYTLIMWSNGLNLKQKLAMIASANFNESLLKKLHTSFVFIDEKETTKLVHKEIFYSRVRPHDSIVNLFFCESGVWYLNEGTNSKQIGECIFKYLEDPNGKVSTEKIGTNPNSNSSVTTGSSVTTSSTEEFPRLGDKALDGKKSNANHIIWGKQKEHKPCLLEKVKELSREEQDIVLGRSCYEPITLLKYEKVLKFLNMINEEGLKKEFEILRELVNRPA